MTLQIPEKLRKSYSSWCFDIATPHHERTSCFTHSYGKFIRGTGSILYTGPLSSGGAGAGGGSDTSLDGNNDNAQSVDRFRLAPPEERSFDASWSDGIDWERDIRYLSGTEIARLMGFPVAEPAAVVIGGDACPEKRLESSVATATGELAMMDGNGEESIRKFSFPEECIMKRQWKLLGNSLNVRVAARVAEMGIRSVLDELG